MRISIEEKLLGNTLGQEVEKCLRCRGQVRCDVLTDFSLKFTRQKLVNFRDKDSHLRNELDKSLRHKDDTIVLSKCSTFADDVSDLCGDL